jgi:addiction module RelE/StbE family toxin
MPIIRFDKKFVKQYDKAGKQIQESFNQRLKLLIANKNSPILGLHKLHGQYSDCWSINVSGDWRAIYTEMEKDKVILFITIGTHSQLYK